ncbi:RNA-binding protein CP33, chloroplastic-like [Miscanthus floridulus]|uniref:RNA-binding protein CP33, chloroplastic-like n=1 Tax=Miscanthus floridulus TaxID=154761 RepID=UPI003459F748
MEVRERDDIAIGWRRHILLVGQPPLLDSGSHAEKTMADKALQALEAGPHTPHTRTRRRPRPLAPPAHKLLPTVSLPLLSSSTHAAPLLLHASRCLPLAPLVASSDAVEWADKEEEEEEAREAFDEEAREVEEEVLASGDEGEGEYATVELPEEAKVYVGNLPYDIDSEGLTQLFDQASIVEVTEVSRTRLTP